MSRLPAPAAGAGLGHPIGCFFFVGVHEWRLWSNQLPFPAKDINRSSSLFGVALLDLRRVRRSGLPTQPRQLFSGGAEPRTALRPCDAARAMHGSRQEPRQFPVLGRTGRRLLGDERRGPGVRGAEVMRPSRIDTRTRGAGAGSFARPPGSPANGELDTAAGHLGRTVACAPLARGLGSAC